MTAEIIDLTKYQAPENAIPVTSSAPVATSHNPERERAWMAVFEDICQIGGYVNTTLDAAEIAFGPPTSPNITREIQDLFGEFISLKMRLAQQRLQELRK